MAHLRPQCFVPCETATRVDIDKPSECIGQHRCGSVGAALSSLRCCSVIMEPPPSPWLALQNILLHIVAWLIHFTVAGFHFPQAASSELGKQCVCVCVEERVEWVRWRGKKD